MNNLAFNKEISVKDLMIKDWVAIKKRLLKNTRMLHNVKSLLKLKTQMDR